MIYVMSDIHGSQEAFDRILAMIQLTEDDHLYIIGDVIDRGPDGIELLNRIRTMRGVTLLLGNHEYMMINKLRNPDEGYFGWLWGINGGGITYDRYKRLPPKEQEGLVEYLDTLPLQISIRVNGVDYVLVHACPIDLFSRFGWKNKDQKEFAVWKRVMAHQKLYEDKTVIFGHTPTMYYPLGETLMRIWHGNNRICVDCGCAYPSYGGQLGCIRLDDMKEFYSGPVDDDIDEMDDVRDGDDATTGSADREERRT